MYEKPFNESESLSDNQILKQERVFNEILKNVNEKIKIKVHQIKFSLLSLKSL